MTITIPVSASNKRAEVCRLLGAGKPAKGKAKASRPVARASQ